MLWYCTTCRDEWKYNGEEIIEPEECCGKPVGYMHFYSDFEPEPYDIFCKELQNSSNRFKVRRMTLQK